MSETSRTETMWKVTNLDDATRHFKFTFQRKSVARSPITEDTTSNIFLAPNQDFSSDSWRGSESH